MSRFNKEDRLNQNKNKAASSVGGEGTRVAATSRDQQAGASVNDPFEKMQPDPATMAVLEDILGKKRVQMLASRSPQIKRQAIIDFQKGLKQFDLDRNSG